jgi:hypothetical protein
VIKSSRSAIGALAGTGVQTVSGEGAFTREEEEVEVEERAVAGT